MACWLIHELELHVPFLPKVRQKFVNYKQEMCLLFNFFNCNFVISQCNGLKIEIRHISFSFSEKSIEAIL